MKPLLLLIIVSMLSVAAAFGQQDDMEMLKKLNHDWLNAYVTRDTAVINRILADDFVLISFSGQKQHKKDVINLALDLSASTQSVTFDSVDVKMVSPSVGILNGWANYIFKANGQEIKGKNCYQDVFVKRNNKWVAVTAHVTSLGAPE